MQKIIQISTDKHNCLRDITNEIKTIIELSKMKTGMANIYVHGAKEGIMIQENWDYSIQNYVVTLLKKLIPLGIWEHLAQDNNGDTQLKAEIVGPSKTIPIIKGKLDLSTW